MVLAIGVVIDNIIGYIKDPEYKYLAAGGAVGAAGGALVAGAVLSGPVGWVALAFVGVGAAVGGGVAVKASRSKKLKALRRRYPALSGKTITQLRQWLHANHAIARQIHDHFFG